MTISPENCLHRRSLRPTEIEWLNNSPQDVSQPNQMWIVNLTTHGWAVNNVGVCLGTGPACDIEQKKLVKWFIFWREAKKRSLSANWTSI